MIASARGAVNPPAPNAAAAVVDSGGGAGQRPAVPCRQGKARLFHQAGDDPAQRERFTGIIARNVKGMQRVLEDLLDLSRIGSGDADALQTRDVLLPDAAAEVVRQLREFAEGRGVIVEVADDLPSVSVPAAALDLSRSGQAEAVGAGDGLCHRCG